MPAAATQCRNIGANRTTAGGHAKFAPGPAVPAPDCPSNEALYWNSSITSPILIWTFKAAARKKNMDMYQRIAFIIVVVSGAAILAYCAAHDILGEK